MRILIFILFFSFLGCKSIEKQRRGANNFFDKHPGELATRCDKQFPVKDSLGEVQYDTITELSNINHKHTIDSLVAIGENAMTQLVYAKKRADTISEECANVVLGYMRDLEHLQRATKRLQDSYKPCSQDTIRAIQTVYRRSIAREASLKDSLDQILYQLGEITNQSNIQIKELSDKDVVISQLKADKMGWMWKAIGTWIGMALILGAGLFFLIKR